MENNTIITILRDIFDGEIRFVIDNDIKIRIYIYVCVSRLGREEKKLVEKNGFCHVYCTVYNICAVLSPKGL